MKLLQQRISNPEFYGDLVYKFEKIIGNPNLSDLLKRIVNRFKRAGYTLDIMRQITCLVLTPGSLLLAVSRWWVWCNSYFMLFGEGVSCLIWYFIVS